MIVQSPLLKGSVKPVARTAETPLMNISADVVETFSTTGTRTFLGVKLFDFPSIVRWKPPALTLIAATWTWVGSLASIGRATENDRSSG